MRVIRVIRVIRIIRDIRVIRVIKYIVDFLLGLFQHLLVCFPGNVNKSINAIKGH